MISDEQRDSLIQAAVEVRKKAYAPYSNYQVGAAILVVDGRIFTGVNVENASYGLTICAERTAVFKAISEGYQKILAVAVATENAGSPSPRVRSRTNRIAVSADSTR
jgi:cytidine deaminase